MSDKATDIPIIVSDLMVDPNIAVLCDNRIFAAGGLVDRLREHPASADEILRHVAVINLNGYDPMKWPEPDWLKEDYVPVSERRWFQ